MASNDPSPALQTEEELVAELSQLGIRYLSRRKNIHVRRRHSPEQLVADLTRQPSSRVRLALIALLLAHPEYAEHVPKALNGLTSESSLTLKLFYTAAVLLQRKYARPLREHTSANWQELPELFSSEIKLPESTTDEKLRALAEIHQKLTGAYLNWLGTYESAARHLLRQWELEKIWSA